MCGLVGIFRTKYNESTIKHKEVFGTMLFADYVRGKDSTGVAAIHTNKITKGGKHEYYLYKRALASFDFMTLPGYTKAMGLTRPVCYIGHNRAATRGSVNNMNAHPFEVGNIILTHNGTLTNKWELPDHTNFDTDSETIAHMLDTMSVEDVANKIEGAWALVWWNKKDNTLNFLRNGERPFFYGVLDKGDTLVWASQEHLIRWSCEHNRQEIDGETEEVTGDVYRTDVNFLYTFEEGNTEPTITEIIIKPKPKPKHRRTTPPRRNLGVYDAKKKVIVYEDITKRNGTQSTAMTTSKVERKAAEMAQKKRLIEGVCDGMIGQQLPFRRTACHDFKSKVDGKKAVFFMGELVPLFSQSIFPEFLDVSVRVNAITRLPLSKVTGTDTKTVWAGTLSNYSILEEGDRLNLKVTNISPFPQYNVEKELEFLAQETSSSKKLLMVQGPEGIFIPCTDFTLMTKHGCAGCGKDIGVDMASELFWVEGDYPVCKVCTDADKHNVLGMSGRLTLSSL